ncbi:arginine--tRNA ligase [Eubacteriales bacterium OttesenSCG-928-M02]|nr:arginine--tRNA ligase [Eubacteriales bacterium OttesenSCG-928-M02]
MPYRKDIATMAAAAMDMDIEVILPLIEVPPKEEMGDFALPCFALAKVAKKAPQAIAEAIVSSPLPRGIDRAEVAGGYANFFVNRQDYVLRVLTEAAEMGVDYGKQNLGKGGVVCIDYSSINIAKPFHIGHLSSTAIGHALYNLYNFLGYQSVGINHLGDWGTQFGKLIWAYKHWSSEKEVKAGGIAHMLDLYVRYHEEAEKNPTMDDEARAYFTAIENGDEEAMEIFTLFKDMTINEIMSIYDLLGITFDSFAGESFYNDKMEPVIEELKEKDLLVQSDGAYIVDLEAYNMPPCMILKRDGSSLYATRDIAAALYRKNTYHFVKSLYVVAYQQNLHFRQLFQVMELMGYDWAKDMEHVAFGMVSLADGGTLSTRRGNVVLLEDVLQTSIEKARETIEVKSPKLADDEKDAVSKQVGVGAVVFGVLYNARIKDIAFSYEKALSYEGETAPYLQYTHARCNSLLENGRDITAEPSLETLVDVDGAYTLPVCKAMVAYKEALVDAMEKNEPYLLSRAIMDVAQAFNRFYYEVRIVVQEDPAGSAARLVLTAAVRDIIKRGLSILGIGAPERM